LAPHGFLGFSALEISAVLFSDEFVFDVWGFSEVAAFLGF